MLQSLSRLGSHHLDLNRSAFRNSAFGLTAAAVIFTGPAFAQQAQVTTVAAKSEQVTPSTDCKTRSTNKEIFGDTKCEVLKGVILDETLAKQDQNLACLRRVKVLFDDGKVSRDTVTKFGKDRACDLLKTLG